MRSSHRMPSLEARDAGVDPSASLRENDAYSFFAALGDLLVTGPTRTNVNDFRAILVDTADQGAPSGGAGICEAGRSAARS
mgnify:CR=1 FL=1